MRYMNQTLFAITFYPPTEGHTHWRALQPRAGVRNKGISDDCVKLITDDTGGRFGMCVYWPQTYASAPDMVYVGIMQSRSFSEALEQHSCQTCFTVATNELYANLSDRLTGTLK